MTRVDLPLQADVKPLRWEDHRKGAAGRCAHDNARTAESTTDLNLSTVKGGGAEITPKRSQKTGIYKPTWSFPPCLGFHFRTFFFFVSRVDLKRRIKAGALAC